MQFDKSLTEPDHVWKHWAIAILLLGVSIGCLGGNALEFQRFKYLRLALSGMSFISAGLGVAKIRQIEARSPYYSQREIMRNDLFLETQAMQIPSFQQQPAPMPIYNQPAPMIMHTNPTGGLMPFNVAEFLDEVTGVAILGNSGSGKTTLAQYIAGNLPPSQVIVFDADADRADEFYPWGDLLVLNDYDQIIEQMEKLLDLLEKRDKTPLVVICDEFPAIRAYAKQKGSDIPDRFILQYGSRGRKRNKFPIFISQSGNVKSLGLDGQGDFLENFALIRLQKIARKYLKNHPDRELFESSKVIAYPMLINDDEFVEHPTHGRYPVARKNLPPMNLKPLVSLPITIPLVEGINQTTPIFLPATPEPHQPHQPHASHTGAEWLRRLYNMECADPATPATPTTPATHNPDMGVSCPECGSTKIKNNGAYHRDKSKSRCQCKDCGKNWISN